MTTASPHIHTIDVRWSDFDMYGHMMNANYLEIAQEARLAFAREHFHSRGIRLIAFVRHLEADYQRPLVWDGMMATVTVETSVVKLGETSFVTRQAIKDGKGEVSCVVTTTQVTIDPQTQQPRPVSEEEKELFASQGLLQLEG